MIVIVILAVVAAGVFYVYRNPIAVSELVNDTPLEGAVRSTLGTTRVYKWRDAEGTVHITDEPPSEGTQFEQLEYQNDANVVPSVGRKNTKNN